MSEKVKKVKMSDIFKHTDIMKLMIPITIVVLSVFFGLMNPNFFSWTNLMNISRQASVIAIAAVAQTIIIISGGIDLAQGSVIGLISCFGAVQIIAYGLWPGMLFSIILAGFVGAVMGGLIARFKIPPFIVTLGGLNFLRGATYIYTNGMPVTGLNDKSFLFIGSGDFLGLPVPLIIAIAVYIFGHIFLSYTRAGREIYAVGGNQEAALLSGIDVSKRKVQAFTIGSIIVGIAALVLTSRISVGQPTLGEGYQLQAIAGAVIGGTSMRGGEGGMLGTAMGVILVSIIGNGLNLLRVSSFTQLMINGAIIVLAVGIDVWQKKTT